MKKLLFTLAIVTLSTAINAQQKLKDLISGPGGISNHFTEISLEDQRNFNPKEARDALELDPVSNLEMRTTEADNLGYTHYRYFQTYKNLPIENSMLIAHVKNGKLTGLSGEIITEFDHSMQARSTSGVSVKNAIAAALNYVNAKKYAWQQDRMEKSLRQQKGNKNATYYPSAQLVWYSAGETINSSELRVAYKIDIYAIDPLSRAFYFVDAQTGKILGKKDELFYTDATGTAATAYSGTKTIHSDLSGGSYRLRDLTKGNGIITLHGEPASSGTDYTSATANWTLAGLDQAALDAHYGVSQTYAFYKVTFNRNSYDNLGTALTSYVNYSSLLISSDNAFWDGTSMHFCKRSNSAASPGGVTGIDITGHELTHGVTQETSGLIYSKEPGAINESMSDILGKSVQFWSKPTDINWQLSNDMNWIIRDMSNPNAMQQPDTYKGTYWSASSGDNYGVHTNSGVGNFMFYLLVNGGTGTNDLGKTYAVTGIGLSKADQILYRTNTTYLTPTSQYLDWRQACLSAAGDLYPGDTAVLASVQNAWCAVGVGPCVGDPCTKPAVLSATGITNKKATVTWSTTGATGYNLKWKTASATRWKRVNNIMKTYYDLTGLTPGTAYMFQVQAICSDTASPFSSSKTFTTAATNDSLTYCASAGTFTFFGFIDEVDLGTIKNASGDNAGYRDYTNLTVGLTIGVKNKIKLTPGALFTGSTLYWTVFADYNQDGDFADPGENIASANSINAVTKAFTVPATAKKGSTRLRVQLDYLGISGSDPCAAVMFGEVEDYTINISAARTITSFDYAAEKPETTILVSPNPVTGSSATVSYTVAQEGKVRLLVMDMFGRLVQSFEAGQKTAGNYTFSLENIGKRSTGTYIIAVLQNNQVVAKTRFIAAK